MFSRWIFSVLAFLACGALSQSSNASLPPSNLPPANPSIFTAQASILIEAPIDTVWHILLDFPSYPDWNPFVRSQVVTDSAFAPTADQDPEENLRLIITSQIPPLDPPVDASSMGNPLQSFVTMENITHLEPDMHRVSWRDLVPELVLDAERWSALSVFVDRDGVTQTFYESREEFNGALALVVGTALGKGLQEGFEAQATALKARAESF